MTDHLLHLLALHTSRFWDGPTGPDRDERGDVPGWVMITVMSAAIVAALTVLALPQLQQMLSNALNSVK